VYDYKCESKIYQEQNHGTMEGAMLRRENCNLIKTQSNTNKTESYILIKLGLELATYVPYTMDGVLSLVYFFKMVVTSGYTFFFIY